MIMNIQHCIEEYYNSTPRGARERHGKSKVLQEQGMARARHSTKYEYQGHYITRRPHKNKTIEAHSEARNIPSNIFQHHRPKLQ
jgi:hypothetical protein